jgi:hypothetical protein
MVDPETSRKKFRSTGHHTFDLGVYGDKKAELY